MKSIIFFCVLSINSFVFTQQDSMLSFPLLSLSTIATTSQTGGQPKMVTSILKEAGYGIGAGLLAGGIGGGISALLDYRSAPLTRSINAIAIGYSFYTIGMGVGTNLARRSESYHPYMLGTITASTLGGLAGLILITQSDSDDRTKFLSTPLYLPLITAMLYNRLIDNQPDAGGNQLSQKISISPYFYENGSGCSIQLAL